MKTTKTNKKIRSREEILAWLDAARQRKAAWERKVEAQWAEEESLKKEAEKNHSYIFGQI